MGNQRVTILTMGRQPIATFGVGKQPVTTPAMGKQPTTIATVTRMPCAATGMNGTTTIGGNNTILLSCWSEADTIIMTRDIGILHGEYDPNYERYDYDGPIYTYGNLLPDQVIVNVQRALKELGYYAGDLNGSLGVNTRNALAAYQQEYGLDITGVVDEATVRALGLI
jgi:hypothetical protein